MSYEWVAPTATGIVGIAGIAGTYFTAKNQRDVTVLLAREERLQRRRESAYVEIQRTVERNMHWADNCFPLISSAGSDPFPAPPMNAEDLFGALALQVFWSAAVRTKAMAWTHEVNRLGRSVAAARAANGNDAEMWQQAPKVKEDLSRAANELLAVMATELMHVEPPGRRWRRG